MRNGKFINFQLPLNLAMLGSFSVMRPAMPSGCLSAGLDGEGSGTAAIGWKVPEWMV